MKEFVTEQCDNIGEAEALTDGTGDGCRRMESDYDTI